MKYALFLLLILVCGLMPIGFLLVGISTLCGSDKLYRFGASLWPLLVLYFNRRDSESNRRILPP